MLKISKLVGRVMKPEITQKAGLRSRMSREKFLGNVCLLLLVVNTLLLSGCPQKPDEREKIGEKEFFLILKEYVENCVVNHGDQYEHMGLEKAVRDSINQWMYLKPSVPPPPAESIYTHFTHNKSLAAQHETTVATRNCVETYMRERLGEITITHVSEDAQKKLSSLHSDLIFKYENNERPNRVTQIDHEGFHSL